MRRDRRFRKNPQTLNKLDGFGTRNGVRLHTGRRVEEQRQQQQKLIMGKRQMEN